MAGFAFVTVHFEAVSCRQNLALRAPRHTLLDVVVKKSLFTAIFAFIAENQNRNAERMFIPSNRRRRK